MSAAVLAAEAPARTAARAGRLEATGLRLTYPSPSGERTTVVDVEHLVVEPGATVGFTGPSGSGKTSLLHLLSGIEQPDGGRIAWGATDVTRLGEGARDAWRRRHVGLVFQDFHLIPGLSVLENVLAPCYFERVRVPGELRARATALLERVGAPGARASITSLSRGEQQRVAIARALLHDPPILLADEPTASLDAANGRAVVDLLLEAAASTGATLLAVSHDPALLARLPSVRRLQAGRLDPG